MNEVALNKLPEAIKAIDNWLVWRFEPNQIPGGKPRKVPYYTNGNKRNGSQGGPKDRRQLASFRDAIAACKEKGFVGLGLAILPGCGVISLDFDRCVSPDGKLDQRIADLCAETYVEFSPSRKGVHAFWSGFIQTMKDNADAANVNLDGSRKDGLYDVEFFGHNGFVTVTGDVLPECELMGYGAVVRPMTNAVTELFHQRFGFDGTDPTHYLTSSASEEDGDGLADLSRLNETLGWSFDEAREILFALDPSDSRDRWVNCLMAIHHELGGSPEALDLVDEWSRGGGDKYGGRRDVESVWRSFGRSGLVNSSRGAVTGRTLLKWRAEAQVQLKYEATEEWRSTLSTAADEFTVREKLCPQISADNRLDEMGRESLAQVLFDTFKRLGTKYPIAQCRKLLAEKRSEKTRTPSDAPKWLDGWVYVTDDDKFFRIDSAEWLSKQGFDAKFNREMPRNEEGEITTVASWYALNEMSVPVVTKAIYLPWAEGRFVLDGTEYANTYRPSSVPEAAPTLSGAGVHARNLMLRHIRLLCDNREAEVQTLLDWLAFNVQHPGVKIRWAPLIKGIEGDGKTSLGTLLRAVMGSVNVRNVSPKVLGTDFTGWSQGSAVVTLEEIRLTGHSRHDILNALKPYVTNDSIEVHAKGKDPFDAINTTNYMAFTNFVDALPLTDTDRRWWILFTPWANREQLSASIGAGASRDVLGAYFDELNRVMENSRAELRRWLLDHPISPNFRPNGSAPASSEKALMIGMNVSEDEMTVRDTIEKGGVGVTKQVFLSSRLRALVSENGGVEDDKTQAWNRLLVRCGYTRLPKKLKWRGRTDPVWVLGSNLSEPDEIRQILLKTLPVGSDDGEEDLF